MLDFSSAPMGKSTTDQIGSSSSDRRGFIASALAAIFGGFTGFAFGKTATDEEATSPDTESLEKVISDQLTNSSATKTVSKNTAGVTDSSLQAALSDSLDATNSRYPTLHLKCGTYLLSGDLTIPKSVRLMMDRGAVIETNGHHLVIEGGFEAGPYRCFRTTATYSYPKGLSSEQIQFGSSSRRRIHVDWFGACENSESTARAIHQAMRSLASHGTLVFGAGVYALEETCQVNQGVSFDAEGTRFKPAADGIALFERNHLDWTRAQASWDGFELCNPDGHTRCTGIKFVGAGFNTLHAFVIKDLHVGIKLSGDDTNTVSTAGGNTILNCQTGLHLDAYDPTNGGDAMLWLNFNGIHFASCETGILIEGRGNGYARGWAFDACSSQSCTTTLHMRGTSDHDLTDGVIDISSFYCWDDNTSMRLEYLSERVSIMWRGGRLNRVSLNGSKAQFKVRGGLHRTSNSFLDVASGARRSRNVDVRDCTVQLSDGARLLDVSSSAGGGPVSWHLVNIKVIMEGTPGNVFNIGRANTADIYLFDIRGAGDSYWFNGVKDLFADMSTVSELGGTLTTDSGGQVTFDWQSAIDVVYTEKPRLDLQSDQALLYDLSWATNTSGEYMSVTVTAHNLTGQTMSGTEIRAQLMFDWRS